MVYNTQATKDKLDHIVDYFVDAVTNPAFKPWELSDNKWKLSLDLAEQSDQSKATELLHKAAYRTGLGNSLYAPEYMVKSSLS
jgi:ubiquinol-cytochrome c reductase core subunit 2